MTALRHQQEAANAEPAVHISIRGPSANTHSDRPCRALLLKVLVQPLQLSYQPACFARVAQILAKSAGKSHAQELLDVISSLESPQIRALSIAELALGSPSLPLISIEVSGTISASLKSACACNEVCNHSAIMQHHSCGTEADDAICFADAEH